jgi:uncharacterized protein YbdZ (MbtH family)
MSAKKSATEITRDELKDTDPRSLEGQTDGAQAQSGTHNSGAHARTDRPFDPTQYLSKFDGRDYLEVKWRLLWLRSEHPDARITTEIVQHNEESGFALFRAEVEIPGGGRATGWGSETVRDFHDYIEAAETKAIGRALAALGYGTQFCQDFDFSAKARPGTMQVVDSPVNLAEPRNVINRASSFGNGSNAVRERAAGGFKDATGNDGGRMPAEGDEFDHLPPPAVERLPGSSQVTEKQLKAIYAIGRASKRLSETQVDDRCAEIFGVLPSQLTKAEASQFIDMLKGEIAA